MTRIRTPLALAAAALLAAGSAFAAPDGTKIDLVRAGHARLADGYSARHLLDMSVRDPQGRPLGEIHELVLDADGRVAGVVVESQGFLEMGDTQFSLPWSHVRFATTGEYATVPVPEPSLPDFSFFNGDERLPLAAGQMRASALLNDLVEVRPMAEYGRVDDLVVDRDGQVRAVVLAARDPAGRAEGQAPAASWDYDPARHGGAIPAGRDGIAALGPFDASRLGG